jgi:hypothetical protein
MGWTLLWKLAMEREIHRKMKLDIFLWAFFLFGMACFIYAVMGWMG